MSALLELVEWAATRLEQEQAPPSQDGARQLMDLVLHHRFGVRYEPVVGAEDSLLAWRATTLFFNRDGEELETRRVLAGLHANPALESFLARQIAILALRDAPVAGHVILATEPGFTLEPTTKPAEDDPWLPLFAGQLGERLLLLQSRDRARAPVPRKIGYPQAGVCQAVSTTWVWDWIRHAGPLDGDWIWVQLSHASDLHNACRLKALGRFVLSAREQGVTPVLGGVRLEEQMEVARQLGCSGVAGPVLAGAEITGVMAWEDGAHIAHLFH